MECIIGFVLIAIAYRTITLCFIAVIVVADLAKVT